MLVEAVRRGTCALGPTQLVVSWGMINRLRQVFARKLVFSLLNVDSVVEEIILVARVGPSSQGPLLVIGGSGVVPLDDEEDAHVLEVAVAGRARVLATANFADFVSYRTKVLKPGRVAIHRTAEHEVIVAHPEEVVAWTRMGEIVLP